jgi:uncharacterized protein YwgA
MSGVGGQSEISTSSIYSLLDSAIILLSRDMAMDRFKVQKGIFYFFWKYSQYKNIDFELIAKKLDMVPYKYGPYSESVDGEVDALISRGYLSSRTDNSIIYITATSKGISEFGSLDGDVKALIDGDISRLVNSLDSKTLVFFIYYNPYIPLDVKKYFTSESEIKEHFARNKEKYIKELVQAGVIENSVAEMMLKGQ